MHKRSILRLIDSVLKSVDDQQPASDPPLPPLGSAFIQEFRVSAADGNWHSLTVPRSLPLLLGLVAVVALRRRIGLL